MSSAFSFVVGLLTAALSLLGFVQQNPTLPQASQNQAVQVAQQAITQATLVLATNSAGTNPSTETNTVDTAPSSFASPVTGPAPLDVSFEVPVDSSGASIDFGDGSDPVSLEGYCGHIDCGLDHIYTQTGTYTAKLLDSNNGTVYATTITVVGGTSQPSASLNQHSLTQSSSNFSISGTAFNATGVVVFLVSGNYQGATDWTTIAGESGSVYANAYRADDTQIGSDHQFSVNFQNIPAGTYKVFVYNETTMHPISPILTGTLTVSATTATPAINAFIANPPTVKAGAASLLGWNGTGSSDCQLSANGSLIKDNVGMANTFDVYPTTTTTYQLLCTLTQGGNTTSASKNVTVTVGAGESVTINPPSLTASSQSPVVLTGTATDVSSIFVGVTNGFNLSGGDATVTNGSWSISVGKFGPGAYPVKITSLDGGGDLTTATLTVTQ